LVDKPAGLTSHDVVARARRALGTRAVGHTGTLDPFATGLLVLLIGRATRLARFVEAQPKTYLAGARLGRRTDTDDLTGNTVGEVVEAPEVPERAVAQALDAALGPQRQRPPAYSAKHVDGERSYRLARRGEAVELAETDVVVHRVEPVSYRWPDLTFRATVSPGTYVRALARDLGERLGVGAHLASLRREAIGALRVDDAVPLEGLTAEAVRPARAVLMHLPALDLDPAARAAVLHGRAVAASAAGGSGADVALLADGELIAVAREVDGWLRPAVVLGVP
jgi:tRNA pseudouridine55 synthase